MTDIDPLSLRSLRIRRVLLAAATSAVAALAVWFVTRPGPARLVEQGIAAVRRDPAKGEQLFRRAIAGAGGQHGDAEIGLCLALAQQGEWDAAAQQFKAVDNTTCHGDLLLTFGRLALKSGHRNEGREALKAVGDRGASQSVPALELL